MTRASGRCLAQLRVPWPLDWALPGKGAVLGVWEVWEGAPRSCKRLRTVLALAQLGSMRRDGEGSQGCSGSVSPRGASPQPPE